MRLTYKYEHRMCQCLITTQRIDPLGHRHEYDLLKYIPKRFECGDVINEVSQQRIEYRDL